VPLQQSDEAAPESGDKSQDAAADPEQLRAAFEAHPELRRAWEEAEAYRETFATPQEARAATALLADLDRMDTLFFSRRPEDHAELARAVASLDPEAFASLAQAMNGLATEAQRHRGNNAERQPNTEAGNSGASPASIHSAVIPKSGEFRRAEEPGVASEGLKQIPRSARDDNEHQKDGERGAASSAHTPTPSVTPAQAEFFHAANAAAVQGVLEAIETQVERLLPEGISTSARQRVVGEIYRELDASLQSNRQLSQQMREAFRSGALDAAHQRAVVSLLTGRAKQALPGVAKRVLGEWTSTIVASNQDRRARQRAAERRVDIAGSGGAANDGRRSMTPRDLDYARLSDADILNL
jgi:hypothetical protein